MTFAHTVILAVCVLLIQFFIYNQLVEECKLYSYDNTESSIYKYYIFTYILLILYCLGAYFLYNMVLEPLDIKYLFIIVLSFYSIILNSTIEIMIKKLSYIIDIMSNTYIIIAINFYMQIGLYTLLIISDYKIKDILIYCTVICFCFSVSLYNISFVMKKLESTNIESAARGLPIAIVTISIIAFVFFGIF